MAHFLVFSISYGLRRVMLNVSANSEDSSQSVNLRGVATGFVLYLKISLASYMLFANRKDSDQPAQMRRLLRALLFTSAMISLLVCRGILNYATSLAYTR